MSTRGCSPSRARRCAPLWITVVLAMGWAAAGASPQFTVPPDLVPRQVATGPEDILSGLVRLPDPSTLATRSRTAWLRLRFEPASNGGWIAQLPVPVAVPVSATDTGTTLSLIPLGPGSERWTLDVHTPDGSLVDLDRELAAGRVTRTAAPLELLGPGMTTTATDFPADPGLWRVSVRAPATTGRRSTVPPDGYLVVVEPGDSVLESHLATHALWAGAPVGVRARWTGIADVTSMALHSRSADGSTDRVIPMADDGRHDDGLPDDGLFGATLPPGPAGAVFAQVVATGIDAHGLPAVRTVEHAFTLIERSAMFTGEASSFVLDDARIGLFLGAWLFGAPRTLHVSTEVWGTDAQGELVPVCWLSSMVPAGKPDPTAGDAQLPLALDVRWLNRVEASAPLELRHLRIQDADTDALVDTLPRLALDSVAAPLLFGAPPGPVLADMTMGPSPLDAEARVTGATTTVGGMPAPFSRGLVLSHGYCSDGGIWPSQDFTGNALQFVDANQNRSHDQFAQLLGGFGAQLDSFGLLAHSQGGNAGLHLYTYYASGLDHAKGGRLIQAVATPWQGSPLASSLAGLGGIFGIGCGANDDLSASGAAVWLAGIPSWARAQVSYWTTQNSGSACNSFTNLFLSSPNDGVVERSKGQLPGATNMGHISGWCHTTGMSNPANYTDHARNIERNAAAAR